MGVQKIFWIPHRFHKGLKHNALQVYHQCGLVAKTIRVLVYPTKGALYTWIENEKTPKSPPGKNYPMLTR